MKCHHWKTPLITITFFPSQVWPIPNSDHPAARPRSCTANILKHFLLWGNDSFSSWDSWKWPRVYILWMAILLSPCIYLWIFSFGLGTALSQVSYALVANWNPSPGKHSFSPRFRYLYAFYWKNVGALNDDFFGFILLGDRLFEYRANEYRAYEYRAHEYRAYEYTFLSTRAYEYRGKWVQGQMMSLSIS